MVISKPTSTTCNVIEAGSTGAIYSGLTTGTDYYLSTTTAGGLTSTPPDDTMPGTKTQYIGTADSTTSLIVNVERSELN